MKNKYLLLVLGFISLVFMGCPYNSEVALDDKPSTAVDTKLIGKWQQRNSDDVTYVVSKKDDNSYTIIEKHKPSSDGSKQDDKTYEAFLSNVNGTKFLNLYDPSNDIKSYYFYKIEISDEIEGFTLYPVTEYITEKFTASGDLKKFVDQYKGLSFFFETKDEYIKVGK